MKLIADMPIPNTLGVAAVAKFGCQVNSVAELAAFRKQATAQPIVVLGEGSNVIPAKRVETLVALMRIRGFELLEDNRNDAVVRVGAGENWHACVLRCLERGWFGLENLALIPGSVGAAPVQNIGAYGVELSSWLDNVDIIDGKGQQMRLGREACEFSYRDSVFKRRHEWCIVSVTLRLSKRPRPVTSYPDVQMELDAQGISQPHPADVARAVMAVRRRKLPDPARVPNVGSFFKNPVVTVEQASALRAGMPDLAIYPFGNDVKLSAAQLIDRAGWKGKRRGDVRCWSSQALVLVNPGHQPAAEVLAFAEAIRRDVLERYGVGLELEPSLLS